MIIPARLPLLLFAAALGGAWWRALPPPAPAFVVPPPVASTLPASFVSATLANTAAHAQSPSLTLLPDGRIAAAWLQKMPAREADATIHLSFWNGQQWSPSRIIVDRRLLANASKAQVQGLGQPTLFAHAGQLHLWLSSTHAGLGSTLHHLQSANAGEHWSAPQSLATSPLFNLGSRNALPPLALADGDLGLPTSHALFAQHGEWLRFDARGQLIDKARLPPATRDPHVVALDEQSALALATSSEIAALRTALSPDGGLRWPLGEMTPPATASAPKALLRLASGRLLLAAHAANTPPLVQLWLSDDRGRSWRETRSIGVEAAAELAMAQGQDGVIHLALGGQPAGIRHLRFSEAWLQGKAP